MMECEDKIKEQIIRRSRGRCECFYRGHEHFGRCDHPVTMESGHFRKIVPRHPANTAFNWHVLCDRCDAAVAELEKERGP